MDVTGTGGTTTYNKIGTSAGRLAEAQDTFLKLLTTQMKNQDPLAPMDATSFTQQVVQMTGVEQSLYTNELLAQMIANNAADSMTSAVGMIGKTITAVGAEEGDPDITGVVTGVTRADGTLVLKIGDQSVPFSSVKDVDQTAAAA